MQRETLYVMHYTKIIFMKNYTRCKTIHSENITGLHNEELSQRTFLTLLIRICKLILKDE